MTKFVAQTSMSGSLSYAPILTAIDIRSCRELLADVPGLTASIEMVCPHSSGLAESMPGRTALVAVLRSRSNRSRKPVAATRRVRSARQS